MKLAFSLFMRAAVCAALMLCHLCGQIAASGPTLKVLYTFKAQGGAPSNIVEVQPGRFLGVAQISPGIFSIESTGNYKYIYGFPTLSSGLLVYGLTPAINAQAYGSATNLGQVGTFSELFSVALNGKVTTYPYNPATQGTPADLEIQSADGSLYTFFGTPGGLTFNRLDYKGNPTLLYTFPQSQSFIDAAPFLGQDGAFYGLLLMNNTADAGIFRLTSKGAFSWIVPSFATGRVNYGIALIQAGNGNFYGTLPAGGSAGAGSIYEVTPSGQMTTLYQFSHREIGIPEALMEASDGMLYGTARGLFNTGFSGYSSVFRLNPTTGEFKTIYWFQNGGVTGECECWLIQGTDGKFYGTAGNEGTYQAGTIFSLDAGLPPPKPRILSFGPASGAVGTKVLLWGRDMLGATAVDFNGTPASSFTVASSQGVWADVPSGATSGPITITTPNGIFTTTESFTVE
jgi:uncharacterized repeat protein (TIGR03803 family)